MWRALTRCRLKFSSAIQVYVPTKGNKNVLQALIIRAAPVYLPQIFIRAILRICVCDIVARQKYGKAVYIAAIRSAAGLLRRFSSLSFGLQITPRCIRTVFQSSTIHTRRNHVCFSRGATQQLFSHPLLLSIYSRLEYYPPLSPFPFLSPSSWSVNFFREA